MSSVAEYPSEVPGQTGPERCTIDYIKCVLPKGLSWDLESYQTGMPDSRQLRPNSRYTTSLILRHFESLVVVSSELRLLDLSPTPKEEAPERYPQVPRRVNAVAVGTIRLGGTERWTARRPSAHRQYLHVRAVAVGALPDGYMFVVNCGYRGDPRWQIADPAVVLDGVPEVDPKPTAVKANADRLLATCRRGACLMGRRTLASPRRLVMLNCRYTTVQTDALISPGVPSQSATAHGCRYYSANEHCSKPSHR